MDCYSARIDSKIDPRTCSSCSGTEILERLYGCLDSESSYWFVVVHIFPFERSFLSAGVLRLVEYWALCGWAGSVSAVLFIAFVTKIPPPAEKIRQSYTDGSEGD